MVLALTIVPSADAAKKRGKFTVTSLKLSKSSVIAGDTFRVSGRVKNRKGRRTDTARVTYTLRKAKSSRRGVRLGGDNIKRTRAGHSRKFSERLRIKKSTAARTYYVFACVRLGSGTRKASCKKR